ncbi:hypothetical protein ABPG77_002094 [Micractinium sp. CCAP 211/92]
MAAAARLGMAAAAACAPPPGPSRRKSRSSRAQTGAAGAGRRPSDTPRPVVVVAGPVAARERLDLRVSIPSGMSVEAAQYLCGQLPSAAECLLGQLAARAGVDRSSITLRSPYLTPVQRPHTFCLPISLPPAAAHLALGPSGYPLPAPWPPAAPAYFTRAGGPPTQHARLTLSSRPRSCTADGVSSEQMAAALHLAFPGAVQSVSRPLTQQRFSEPCFLLTLVYPARSVPRSFHISVAGERFTATVTRSPRRLVPLPAEAVAAAADAPPAAAPAPSAQSADTAASQPAVPPASVAPFQPVASPRAEIASPALAVPCASSPTPSSVAPALGAAPPTAASPAAAPPAAAPAAAPFAPPETLSAPTPRLDLAAATPSPVPFVGGGKAEAKRPARRSVRARFEALDLGVAALPAAPTRASSTGSVSSGVPSPSSSRLCARRRLRARRSVHVAPG